jgi:hypothetical protein
MFEVLIELSLSLSLLSCLIEILINILILTSLNNLSVTSLCNLLGLHQRGKMLHLI